MHLCYKPRVAALAVGGLLAWASSAAAQYPPVFVPANPNQTGWNYPAVMPQMMPQANYYPVLTPVYPSPTPVAQPHQLVSWPSKKPCPTCTDAEPPAVKPKEADPGKQPDAPKVDLPPQAPQAPAFQPEQAAAGGGEGFALDSGVGYIDSALIRNIFRLRYDAAYGANRPDRAEFFYAKCGGYRINGADPNANGPPPGAFASSAVPVPGDSNVNYQEVSAYLEYAFAQRISGFIEVPVRFVNFSIFPQQEGFGDINAGIKTALVSNDCQVLTFQFRTYISTAVGERGLGTQHISLEPALLFYQRASDKVAIEGEFRYWLPLDRIAGDGTPVQADFKGDVLRYGIGISYLLMDRCNVRVTPVAEVVGWTVLNGNELDPDIPFPFVESAAGDTIVNGKFGVRVGRGKSDIYVGYGRALTGEFWYKDVFRLEFRRAF